MHILATATPCVKTNKAHTIVHAWMVTVVTAVFVLILMNAQTTPAVDVILIVQCVIEMLTVRIHQATIPVNVKMDTLVMASRVQVGYITFGIFLFLDNRGYFIN